MIKLTLPFWLSGPELTKLKNSCETFYTEVAGWLRWPLSQLDPVTCSEGILNVLAWQRDISRFNGEPLSLFRKRVTYAFINNVDAGSTAGIKRILERLGVGYCEVDERTPGLDWDIITLKLSDSQLAQNPELLEIILQMYGRTCRRYVFSTITPMTLFMGANAFVHDQVTEVAQLDTTAVFYSQSSTADHSHQMLCAQLSQ
ncbi:phage tail protein [Zooshikella ganghwensis]|uniref:Phage tail protein n=1 Tax=Zooshikella ganghwensis TaxID=202772 RepID=A0A4P9VDP9_9GAMM|nr:phage tail protein [Zooshikella ganghwensis]RDH41195.1 phage tail protein [Zooshikella ganghwensis]